MEGDVEEERCTEGVGGGDSVINVVAVVVVASNRKTMVVEVREGEGGTTLLVRESRLRRRLCH